MSSRALVAGRSKPGFKLVMTGICIAALQACGGGGGGSDNVAGGDGKTLLSGRPGGSTTSTSTAQAIWSDVAPSDTFLVVNENRNYRFQTASFCQGATDFSAPVAGSCGDGMPAPTDGAASYYGALTVHALWNCVQTRNKGVLVGCDPATQPAAPAMPPPSNETIESLLAQAECTFWLGGSLPELVGKVQSADLAGTDGFGKWTVTWNYTAAPLSTDAVAEKTAFAIRVLGTDGAVGISVAGNFYGESAKQGSSDPGPKYSFSMRASDGSVRVSNVVATWVSTTDPSVTGTMLPVSLTLKENTLATPVDFLVPDQASMLTLNGTTSLLSFSQLASTILNTDWFKGNDNGGADGSALALVNVDLGTMTVPASGSYDVNFSAMVKDLSAVGSAGTVTFQKKVTISGQPKSCQAPGQL